MADVEHAVPGSEQPAMTIPADKAAEMQAKAGVGQPAAKEETPDSAESVADQIKKFNVAMNSNEFVLMPRSSVAALKDGELQDYQKKWAQQQSKLSEMSSEVEKLAQNPKNTNPERDALDDLEIAIKSKIMQLEKQIAYASQIIADLESKKAAQQNQEKQERAKKVAEIVDALPADQKEQTKVLVDMILELQTQVKILQDIADGNVTSTDKTKPAPGTGSRVDSVIAPGTEAMASFIPRSEEENKPSGTTTTQMDKENPYGDTDKQKGLQSHSPESHAQKMVGAVSNREPSTQINWNNKEPNEQEALDAWTKRYQNLRRNLGSVAYFNLQLSNFSHTIENPAQRDSFDTKFKALRKTIDDERKNNTKK